MKIKSYRCFNQRTETIIESANVKVGEKFGVQERIPDENSDEEVNPKTNQQNVSNYFMKLKMICKNIVKTKWVFKNKMNEQGEAMRNNTRLVCKEYS